MSSELHPLFDSARTRFVELVAPLSAEQWESPTLCEGWRIRDMAGHLNHVSRVTFANSFAPVVKARFNLNRAFDVEARREGARPVPEIIDGLRELIGTYHVPPTSNVLQLISDWTVHTIEVQRALGLDPEIDPTQLAAAWSFAPKETRFTGTRGKIRGLKFVGAVPGSSQPLEYGSGPEVAGPATTVLLAMLGRNVRDELVGDGAAEFSSRFR